MQRIPLLIGLCGLLLGALRWAMQGTGTLWTSLSRTFYIQDPQLGWAPSDDTWVWLGGEVVILSAIAVVGTWAMFRLAKAGLAKDGPPWWGKAAKYLGMAGAAACLATPLLPVYAMVSGLPPEGARLLLPDAAPQAAAASEGTALPAIPAGTWRPAAGKKQLVVARIAAGNETFDGQFSGAAGQVKVGADPKATSVALSVQAGSIETGIPLRNDHAAADLKHEEHPEVSVRVEQLDEVFATEDERLGFASEATLKMAGKPVKVPVKGTARVADGGQLLLEAVLTVDIGQTGLDVKAFDEPTITVNVRLVLERASDG